MIFALRKQQSENDVTVANISTARVRSEHIMNITDHSSRYPDNNISILREISSRIMVAPIAYNGYVLEKYNIFNSILLTNEYSYSLELGTKVPLYYSHRINNNIYTKNVSPKSVRKKIMTSLDSERKIKGLIPRNGKYIIPIGSISVSRVEIDNSLTARNFFMDYGNGELVITGTIVKDETYLITYLLVEDKFTITVDDSVVYRISLEKAYPDSNNYFRMEVLTTSLAPVKVKYISAETNGTAREYTSYTIGENLYTTVTPEIRKSIISRNLSDMRVFSIEEMEIEDGSSVYKYFIFLPFGSTYDTFSFKSADKSNSIVKLKQIPNVAYEYNWQAEVTTGQFESDSVIYEIPENRTRQRKINDEPVKVNNRIISLTRENPMVSIDEYGVPSGITVTTETGENISIEKVDVEKSLVYLAESVRMTDRLFAEYYIRNNTIEYEKISFNPLVPNPELGNDISQYIIIILMIPKLRAINGLNRYLYHMALPKYSKEGIKNYSYDDIYEAVNGTPNLRSLIKGLNTSMVAADELVILGSVYLSNCLDEDAYLLEDARVYGGGMPNPARDFCDYSFYDGERTDLNTILHVFIKQEVYDNLYDRILQYDRDVQMYQGEPLKMPAIAHKRTMEIINAKVEKFLPVGTEWEVVIG